MGDWNDSSDMLNLAASERTPDTHEFGLKKQKPQAPTQPYSYVTDVMSFAGVSNNCSRQPGRVTGDMRPRGGNNLPQLAHHALSTTSGDHAPKSEKVAIVAGGSLSINRKNQAIQQVAALESRDLPTAYQQPNPRPTQSRGANHPSSLAANFSSGTLQFESKNYGSSTGWSKGVSVGRILKKGPVEHDENSDVQELSDDDDNEHIFVQQQGKVRVSRGSINFRAADDTCADLLQQSLQMKAKMRKQSDEVDMQENSKGNWLDRRQQPKGPAAVKKAFQPPKQVKQAESSFLRQTRSAQKQKSKEPETIDLLDSDEDISAGHTTTSLSSANLSASVIPDLLRRMVKLKVVFFGLLCYQSTYTFEQRVALVASNEGTYGTKTERKVYWEFLLERDNKNVGIEDRIDLDAIKSVK
ncbi:hypothetical protein EON65_31205 [archaeon]|nr:MAG: hypothetical protein EON65_31205 [archaeon]